MAQTAQAVILLSRGGYSRAPQEQINKVVASLHAARLDALVLGAMVEKGEPSLPSALQKCAEAGVRHITVLPIFSPVTTTCNAGWLRSLNAGIVNGVLMTLKSVWLNQ